MENTFNENLSKLNAELLQLDILYPSAMASNNLVDKYQIYEDADRIIASLEENLTKIQKYVSDMKATRQIAKDEINIPSLRELSESIVYDENDISALIEFLGDLHNIYGSMNIK